MSELLGHCTIKSAYVILGMAERWKADTTITAEVALAEIEVGNRLR